MGDYAQGTAVSFPSMRVCRRTILLCSTRQRELQADVDRLLTQHQRLMQSAKAPPPATNWFEGANLTLARLAANPDPRAVQIFVAALAQLQTCVGPIA